MIDNRIKIGNRKENKRILKKEQQDKARQKQMFTIQTKDLGNERQIWMNLRERARGKQKCFWIY